MTNGKRKGNAGEREAAQAWQAATGMRSRRSRQYCGTESSADLVIGSGGLHPEVKRLKRIAILKALRQAERDAAASSVPFALIREDGDTRWAVLVRLDDLNRLLDAIRSRTE